MINIFTDGGARGNPGPAAIGVFISDQEGLEIFSLGKRIGETTNNVAEYTAVIEALSYVILEKKNLSLDKISFFLDSELVCRQINGIYKVKDAKLRDLLFNVRQKEGELGVPIIYSHIPREKNKQADRMVNAALDNLI